MLALTALSPPVLPRDRTCLRLLTSLGSEAICAASFTHPAMLSVPRTTTTRMFACTWHRPLKTGETSRMDKFGHPFRPRIEPAIVGRACPSSRQQFRPSPAVVANTPVQAKIGRHSQRHLRSTPWLRRARRERGDGHLCRLPAAGLLHVRAQLAPQDDAQRQDERRAAGQQVVL
jgi:hypothetical protein